MPAPQQPSQGGHCTGGGITFNPNGGASLTVAIPPEIARNLHPQLIDRVERANWLNLEMVEGDDLTRLTEAYSVLLEQALIIHEKSET